MQHLKDETNNIGTYEIGYLSTMALSSFLNFSSPPSYRTGLLLLVELIRLAGDKTEGWNENWTKNWNDEDDEVGLAGVSGLGIRPGR